MKNEIEINNSTFESIKHVDENGNEYWEARELMLALDYTKWKKFKEVINKSINACKDSNYNVVDHFTGAGKMVRIGSKKTRKVTDYKLSRYICYLIV